MKKILCTLALMLVAFMTHAQMLPETGASRIAAASTKTGDVNGDYKVAIDDVTMIISYLIEQAGNNFIVSNADVNHDGVITISDVVATAMLVFEGDKPQSYLSCPDNNHPHMIDLGLPSGTKWACCNVGADKPEAYGGYYAWGETEEKMVFNQVTYKYCTGEDTDGDGWYDSNVSCQSLGSDIAGTQYDVAHVKWGGSWVMPSFEQMKELLDNCTNEWTTRKSTNGRAFIGSNGGILFLPAAGGRWDNDQGESEGFGCYWLSTQNFDPYNFDFYWEDVGLYDNDYRYFGRTVRPVYVGSTFKPLALSMNNVEIEVGEDATVEITSGNGSYTVGSSRTNVATASLSGATINITGVAAGIAVVTVTDTSTGSSKDISVSVTVAKPQAYLTCPDNNHPHIIDLGLPSGTKWACCNVGATKPEAYGGYYAWGETEEKTNYNWKTYTHCDGSENTCHNLGNIACTEYDVAHVKWGNLWQIPTLNQIRELYNKCTSVWITINGVKGRKYTGPSGGTIFLPAAGVRLGNNYNERGSYGYYWASTQESSQIYRANGLGFHSNFDNLLNNYLYAGQSVRPVSSN